MLGQGQIVPRRRAASASRGSFMSFDSPSNGKRHHARGTLCVVREHVPYFPVIEMLQTVCNIEETDPIETVDARCSPRSNLWATPPSPRSI